MLVQHRSSLSHLDTTNYADQSFRSATVAIAVCLGSLNCFKFVLLFINFAEAAELVALLGILGLNPHETMLLGRS